MKLKTVSLKISGFVTVLSVLLFSSGPNAADLPPAAKKKIRFKEDIRPIFETRCMECHGRGKGKGGFHIDTREQILQGSDNGSVVVTGNSAESYLIEAVGNPLADSPMPPRGDRLTEEQISLLRAWIDQGLDWEPGFTFARFPEARLEPRLPVVPGGSAEEEPSPIDRFVERYFRRTGFDTPDRVPDRIFIRRVYFDVLGLPPPKKELEKFLRDPNPDKREKLVNQVLADHRGYAEHWITFWNDLLRNDFTGTGYIDGGRKQITQWLYQSLEENVPYDEFVRNLISPVEGSEGFIKGIVWRGVTNSSQTPEMQAAQNISQVFMGINLKCASCHDSFISNWKLEDAYSLASVFAEEPLEVHRCDSPTGKVSRPGFLYPRLGEVDPTLPKEQRQSQLAEIVTHPENGRFTRTIVNRIWARVMGRGLIEPNDEMDNPPWDEDLLDWLSAEFAAHGYDLKWLLKTILTSKTYQLPSVAWNGKNLERFVFRGPVIRRLTAEQFRDALCSITGSWPGEAAAEVPFGAETNRAGPRAWLLKRDPLLVAMGRPNRDQINSQRPSLATTLVALELSNGSTLSALITEGARSLMERFGESKEDLVRHLYLSGFSREPTEEELRMILEELGKSPTQGQVEDLLWTFVMLPEFQLIY